MDPKLQPAASGGKVKTEETQHAHSFTFSLDCDPPHMVTCLTAGSVLDSLYRSQRFQLGMRLAKGKKLKNVLVIVGTKHLRGAVAPHVPCSFIQKDEHFNLSFINKADVPAPECSGSVWGYHKTKQVTFYIRPQGTRGRRVMGNPAHEKCGNICVCAFEGEKVEDALRRDGRFHPVVFLKKCVLSGENVVELSCVVDSLQGEEFTLRVSTENRQQDPPTQEVKTEPATADPAAHQPVPTDPAADPHNPAHPAENSAAQASSVITSALLSSQKHRYRHIKGSEKVLEHLRSEFKALLQHLLKTEGKSFNDVQKLIREEFGKNTECFSEVRKLKWLSKLSDYVCHIFIDSEPEGSGFLLFGNFVLTNFHVVQNHLKNLFCTFDHLDTGNLGQLWEIKPEPVVAYQDLDYILLELWEDKDLPESLLSTFGWPPVRGGVCIIGHPEVKKHDRCAIIEFVNRDAAIQSHVDENREYVHIISETVLQLDISKMSDDTLLTYNTFFFYGSSGSPVFDEHGRLVAMHTGGYAYLAGKQKKSIIEYSVPMWRVLKSIIGKVIVGAKWRPELLRTLDWITRSANINLELQTFLQQGANNT